ncbi:endonuclease/exonuclease/phosphatase family protein [Amaricoccus solimangrovi]|uniref:Endonuclease/exonuclease/phosphatase family protein n=1 Tax=Amaricoccus solimangrovi TaxID=2589815 RepID=A0A501WVK1_9RHOB|nr:endonuclease/exonuclease/phosphatase family protein [Amaricoccus solimangrovi]
MRVAAYDVGLSRSGPGLLLFDLRARKPPADIAAVLAVIRETRPDILLLTGFDQDFRGVALTALRARLAAGAGGIDYPFAYAPPGNAGVESGFDLDGDGRLRGAGDALGWGRFPGQGGMALLSRLPVDAEASHDFSGLPWADLPGARLPIRPHGAPVLDPEARSGWPLASNALWDVAVTLPGGRRLRLLASNPTPPLFDGPEQFNLLRNADEIRFWRLYLDGAAFPDSVGRMARLDGPFVLLGDLNTDPVAGAGDRAAIAALLAHPALRDPNPPRATARAGERALRLDYALPARELDAPDAAVFWPEPGEPLAELVAAGPAHRLVWVDLRFPDP